ncbi:hypothetical protein Mapa_010803 [Marchantia paleacea]|nr:hypothetical protein Mapa_010803 [Marchantia paleacea]
MLSGAFEKLLKHVMGKIKFGPKELKAYNFLRTDHHTTSQKYNNITWPAKFSRD